MPLTMNQSAPKEQPQAGRSTPSQEYPALPDNEIVDAEIVRCQIRSAPSWVDYNQEVSFGFRVSDGEFKGRWLWAQTEAKLENDPTCTLTNWIMAILSISSLPEDFEFDESEFVDDDNPIPVKVQVRQYYSKKYDEFRNEVVSILPVGATGSNTAEEVFGA